MRPSQPITTKDVDSIHFSLILKYLSGLDILQMHLQRTAVNNDCKNQIVGILLLNGESHLLRMYFSLCRPIGRLMLPFPNMMTFCEKEILPFHTVLR